MQADIPSLLRVHRGKEDKGEKGEKEDKGEKGEKGDEVASTRNHMVKMFRPVSASSTITMKINA